MPRAPVTSVGDRPGRGPATGQMWDLLPSHEVWPSPAGQREPLGEELWLLLLQLSSELCCLGSPGASLHTDPTLVPLPVIPQALPSPSFGKWHCPTKNLTEMDPH